MQVGNVLEEGHLKEIWSPERKPGQEDMGQKDGRKKEDGISEDKSGRTDTNQDRREEEVQQQRGRQERKKGAQRDEVRPVSADYQLGEDQEMEEKCKSYAF